jgi:hypothetical protein
LRCRDLTIKREKAAEHQSSAERKDHAPLRLCVTQATGRIQFLVSGQFWFNVTIRSIYLVPLRPNQIFGTCFLQPRLFHELLNDFQCKGAVYVDVAKIGGQVVSKLPFLI